MQSNRASKLRYGGLDFGHEVRGQASDSYEDCPITHLRNRTVAGVADSNLRNCGLEVDCIRENDVSIKCRAPSAGAMMFRRAD